VFSVDLSLIRCSDHALPWAVYIRA
jgi:hypothetical protein